MIALPIFILLMCNGILVFLILIVDRCVYRFLGTLKRYVTNRARPEGSIAEAYIAKESVNFIKRYLKGEFLEERNDDGGERGLRLDVFTQRVRPFAPITRAPNVSPRERNLAHWFVLYNTPEVIPYLE